MSKNGTDMTDGNTTHNSMFVKEAVVEEVKEADQWKHRAKGMKCATCMWYVPKVSDTGVELGRCRRHAPTMNGYPAVFPADWCGDHKLDETKVSL